jgi:hypothetical protein
MCRPVPRQSRFSLIFFVQQEPEPEPEPRAKIRFRFFLGQNYTVPAVPVPAPVPVPQHWLPGLYIGRYLVARPVYWLVTCCQAYILAGNLLPGLGNLLPGLYIGLAG